MSYEDAPTLRPRLRALLAEALTERFGSEAVDAEAALVCGDATTSRRIEALQRVALSGRRVLNLGAGIGDLARAARHAGAELVDAVDADGEAIRLARLLSVAQDVDRVSFFEGDAGLASTYADEYDVILAFAQLSRIAPILPRIAQNLRGVLIVEAPADGDPAGAALTGTLPARAVLLDADGEHPPILAWASEPAVVRQHLAGEQPEATDAPAAAHAS